MRLRERQEGKKATKREALSGSLPIPRSDRLYSENDMGTRFCITHGPYYLRLLLFPAWGGLQRAIYGYPDPVGPNTA
jgi:hypothetical protein